MSFESPSTTQRSMRRTRNGGVRSFALLTSTLAIAFASPIDARRPDPPLSAQGQVAVVDAPQTLPNGARFVVPKGWLVRTDGPAIILATPEADSHIAIVATEGTDPDAAVAKAWAIYRPGFAASQKGFERGAREGWDRTRSYRYENWDSVPRDIFALALLNGRKWTVFIHDMTEEVADRRDAQFEIVLNTLLPKGYVRESFAGRTAHRLDPARVAQLELMANTALKELRIPGIALGLVQDGRVIFQGGLGVRKFDSPAKVDADTLFNVASNGKAWTTLMLAKLVQADRFEWTTPVQSVWPEFRLGDPETSRLVQVRQLVCACTGMPRQDYEWLFEGDHSTPTSIMRLLSTTQPTTTLGDTYQYSNLMAAAAGFLGGHVLYPRRELGAAYDAAMNLLVFKPLGMTATVPVTHRAPNANHAAGHGLDVDHNMRVVSQGLNYAGISTRPSGNHWSNVRDMLRYVQMELARGLLPDGQRYIGEDPLLARREPQVTEGRDEYYGMGLKIDRQWGVPVIHHGGTAIGYRSDMMWLPDHNVGAVILTNSDTGTAFRSVFRRRLLELLFDGRPIAMKQMHAFATAAEANDAELRKTLTVPADPAAAGQLAARYRSSELGELTVRRKNGKTWFDFGGWASEMASHRDKGGTVSFVTISPGEDGYTFSVGDSGGKKRLSIRDAQHEYLFVQERP